MLPPEEDIPKAINTNSNLEIKPIELKPEKIESLKNSDPSNLTQKEYKVWYNWWSNFYTTDDYLKFLATQVLKILLLIQPCDLSHNL